jgi:NADH dehydrogenase/NADH:ubiquinone oxidoreductase subunit G
MKKKNTPQPTFVYSEKILQEYEDAALKKAETSEKSFHEDNLEAFMDEVKDYSRAELIQALREARNQADEFALWLLSKNRSKSEIAEKMYAKELNEKNSKEKRAQARKEQSQKKTVNKPESKVLGVVDFYEPIREAVTIYRNWDDATKDQYSTETSGIQKIVIDLLSQPNRSSHTYNKDEWAKIVSKEVKSTQVGIAKTQLKRALKEAT